MKENKREHIESYGEEYPNKSFFILRRWNKVNGLGSDIIVFLGMLKYMESKIDNPIPLIDMKNYYSSIAEKSTPDENVWEYFFMQPCCHNDAERAFTLDDITKAKRVVISETDEGYYELPNSYNMEELMRGVERVIQQVFSYNTFTQM